MPVISIATALGIVVLGSLLLWPSRPEDSQKTVAAAPVEQTPVKQVSIPPAVPPATTPATASTIPPTTPAPAKVSAPAQPGVARIDLEATEPTWISVTEEGGHSLMSAVLEPNNVRSLNLAKPTVVRAGNASGLTIRFNGKSIGPIGPHGGVRDVEFKNGTYRIVDQGK